MKNGNTFISPKQLAARYGIHPNTLRRELRLIKGLKVRKFQRVFNLNQLKIIFTHLGNPFSE
jgi:DNA-binding transcriptional regulator YhcF (GntR family)